MLGKGESMNEEKFIETETLEEFLKLANPILDSCQLMFSFEADIKFNTQQFTNMAGTLLFIGNREQNNDVFGQFKLYNLKLILLYNHPDQYNALFTNGDIYVFVSRIYTHYRILPFRTRILIYSKKVT